MVRDPNNSVSPTMLDHATGWLCMLLGCAILAAVMLIPAWMDWMALKSQNARLRNHTERMQYKSENYHAFVNAIERNEPMLLTRLAWRHLKLKPLHTELIYVSTRRETVSESMNHWMEPPEETIAPDEGNTTAIPDTLLIRFFTGDMRLCGIAIGGSLILLGILISLRPQKPSVPPLPVCDDIARA